MLGRPTGSAPSIDPRIVHHPQQRLTFTLIATVVVAALGGSLLGFDTAVIAGTTQSLVEVFQLSPGRLGLTVSAALWGTVVGAMGSGILGRRYGGRAGLRILAACYLVSALGCALTSSWAWLIAFRFVGGLGMGGSSVIAPVYIAEIAPARWRGRLVGAFQINIIGGILLAYLSNYLLGERSLGPSEWRWQLGVAALPAGVFLLALLGIPASPRWLVSQGRLAEARAVMRRLGSADPEDELTGMVRSLDSTTASTARLFTWRYRRPIILAMLLAMFNQLIGINAVLYYLNDIFAMAGFDRTSQHSQAVLVGVVMLVATLVAMGLIDRFGRRGLLLTGSVGMAGCLGAVAWIFWTHHNERLLLPLVMGYVACFAFSQGSVIWVYLSEIFPDRVRAQGQSLGSSTHWVMDALVSLMFPILASLSPVIPFAGFCAMVIVQFFAVLLFFPETSGAKLEDIQRLLVGAESGA
jgi:SP family arabinose:H+ symporter-like MFS transporter